MFWSGYHQFEDFWFSTDGRASRRDTMPQSYRSYRFLQTHQFEQWFSSSPFHKHQLLFVIHKIIIHKLFAWCLTYGTRAFLYEAFRPRVENRVLSSLASHLLRRIETLLDLLCQPLSTPLIVPVGQGELLFELLQRLVRMLAATLHSVIRKRVPSKPGQISFLDFWSHIHNSQHRRFFVRHPTLLWFRISLVQRRAVEFLQYGLWTISGVQFNITMNR